MADEKRSGFLGRMKESAQSGISAVQAHKEATLAAMHYEAEVNKGSINMGAFTSKMNQRWADGWKLAHVFGQHGNTVMIWERRTDH